MLLAYDRSQNAVRSKVLHQKHATLWTLLPVSFRPLQQTTYCLVRRSLPAVEGMFTKWRAVRRVSPASRECACLRGQQDAIDSCHF